jgi:hypothetical protein
VKLGWGKGKGGGGRGVWGIEESICAEGGNR